MAVTSLVCLTMLTLVAAEPFLADFDRLRQLAESRYGPAARQTIEGWQQLLTSSAGQSREQQLEQINNFVNHKVVFAEDLQIWGEKDYWATPLEAFGRGAGDCEDSAFAKYVSLLQLGIDDRQLRLIYVRAALNGSPRAHMVLGYYAAPDREPLILDSLRNEILPASRRPDLFPIYSFNASGLWVGGNSSAVATPSAGLSNWRSILSRMKEEGWR